MRAIAACRRRRRDGNGARSASTPPTPPHSCFSLRLLPPSLPPQRSRLLGFVEKCARQLESESALFVALLTGEDKAERLYPSLRRQQLLRRRGTRAEPQLPRQRRGQDGAGTRRECICGGFAFCNRCTCTARNGNRSDHIKHTSWTDTNTKALALSNVIPSLPQNNFLNQRTR